MATTARVRGHATSKTFVYMWIGARHQLRLAKASPDGQLYTCLSAMLLTAFMLEAFLNHLGQERHADWERIERGIPKTRKFHRLAQEAGLAPAMDQRPYSSLLQVFAFRDAMAHGRTVTEEVDAEIEIAESISKSLPGPQWQEMITVETAETLLADAESIVRELHRASGFAGDPFLSGGSGLYMATRDES